MSGHRRKEVSNRIARIHGHVHGISRMLDEGRSYSEVAHQIVAVRSSLDSAIQVIIDDLVEDCMNNLGKKDAVTGSLDELHSVVAAIG